MTTDRVGGVGRPGRPAPVFAAPRPALDEYPSVRWPDPGRDGTL